MSSLIDRHQNVTTNCHYKLPRFMLWHYSQIWVFRVEKIWQEESIPVDAYRLLFWLRGVGVIYTPPGTTPPKDHTHPRTITPPRPHPTPSFMLPIVGFVRLRTYLLDKCQLKLEIQRERKADSTEKIYLHLITCFHRTIHKEWILNPLQACRVACTPGPS